ISSDQSWLVPSIASGSGDSTFQMSAAVNNTGAERTATVTVKTTNNTSKGTVKVTQAPAAATVSVSTAQELRSALYGNNPHNNEYLAKGTIIQMQNDINLEDLGEWAAISVYERSFILDGAGHTLTINAVGDSEGFTLHAGLLNWVTKSNITIKNLGVVGRIVADSTFEGLSTTQMRAGSLAAYIIGGQFKVENSYFVNVNQGVLASRDYRASTAKASAGGFFGEISSYADVKISDCFVNGDVKASTMTQSVRNIVTSYAGGFVGQINGNSNLTIERSYAAGTVDSRARKHVDVLVIPVFTAQRFAGGLVGRKDDLLSNGSNVYAQGLGAYWCNELLWLGTAPEWDYTIPDTHRTQEQMRGSTVYNALNAHSKWTRTGSNNDWPILDGLSWTPVLDSVLYKITDSETESKTPYQKIADAAMQLAGFDVYYENVIENKLYNRAEFDGFEAYQYDTNLFIDGIHYASHAIAHKNVGGKTVVIIAIRGTGTEHDRVIGALDLWVSNLNFGYVDPSWNKDEHKGFYTAADTIWGNLIGNYLPKYNLNQSDLVFLVTGHSRGAATGNLLSVSLNEEYVKDDVFSYNFATPPNVKIVGGKDRETDYNNIFYINNENDSVINVLGDIPWTRYGKGIQFTGGEIDGMWGGGHRAEKYQEWVDKGLPDSSGKKRLE
ncbi:MAG: hypothetical protein FWH26_09110, partial [Oscillospiraceae bacterium]|nr:hypothetical protein [Oscillospiraceae bacterium]